MMMMYAVGRYRIVGGLCSFEGYIKIFYYFKDAMEEAFYLTIESEDCCYYHVEELSDDYIKNRGLKELIEDCPNNG